MERTLAENAVHAELIEHYCNELTAIKSAVPALLEVHIIEAAYGLAAELGWGDSDAELRSLFRRVAARLGWPTPAAVLV